MEPNCNQFSFSEIYTDDTAHLYENEKAEAPPKKGDLKASCSPLLRGKISPMFSRKEKDARDYLVDLLNSKNDDDDDRLEKILLGYSPCEILSAGLENGSDEAISKSRYLLRKLDGNAWPAWIHLMSLTSDSRVADYVGDIVDCQVSFLDIAKRVFDFLSTHPELGVQTQLLESIDEISSDCRTKVLVNLSGSKHGDVSHEATEVLHSYGFD